MPKDYLLRHGQSEANVRGILAGPDNSVKLSEKGRRESRIVSKHLQKIEFTHIYSSPISRCLQTVDPLTSAKPQIPLLLEERIQEMNYGDWNGKDLKSLSKKREWKSIQNQPSKFKFPQGESFTQLRKRVQSFLNEIESKTGPILVVSHGDVIKMILTCTLELSTDNFQKFLIQPASISIINYESKVRNLIISNQRLGKSSLREKFGAILLGGENA
jgi:broad specificity phosphatase PhoE